MNAGPVQSMSDQNNALGYQQAMAATGGQVSNPENLADTLRPALIDISGTTRHGRQVDGLDFWRAGSNGAGGAFSSDGGRRALAGTLRELLPPLRA